MRILQVELEAPRDREHAWLAAQREQLEALACAPGGVCFRLWRERGAPGRFLWLESWQTPEDAAGRASQQRASGARLEEFDLLDMAWGRDADAFLRPGLHADHIRAGVGPGKWHDWRVYSRNFVSVMARQPGLVAHETLHCREDPLGFVALRTLVSRAAARIGPEFEPPEEVRLATEPGETRGVYRGGPAPIYRELELVLGAWGERGRPACDRFMYDLQPV